MFSFFPSWTHQHSIVWITLLSLLSKPCIAKHSSYGSIGWFNATLKNSFPEIQMIIGNIVTVSSNDAARGHITSPNYPRPFGSNTSAVVLLTSDVESTYDSIRVTFEDLNLELSNFCEAEVIELTNHYLTPNNNNNNNRNSKSHLICGNSLPLPFLFKGKYLMIYLASDAFASGRSRGFKMRYEFLNYFSQTFNGCSLANHYKCRNRRCIPNHLKCDRRDDCGDGSDEDKSGGCQNLPTIPYPIDYQCGLYPSMSENQNTDLLNNRINGGRRSNRQSSWPFQVSIQQVRIEPVSHTCGGTLIHPMFVMTAAHCFKDFSKVSDYKIILGGRDLVPSISTTEQSHTLTTQVRYASFISLYPGNGIPLVLEDMSISHDHSNDLALIELNAPVQLNPNVWPACLPHLNEQTQAGRKCLTCGYGDTHGTGSPLALKHVAQVIEHPQHCTSRYSNFQIDDYNMICVRSQLGSGPCNGDSGGPLFCGDSASYNKPVSLAERGKGLNLDDFQPGQIIRYFPVASSATNGNSKRQDEKIRFTVHGITSFTTDGNTDGGYCGLEKIPIIYARVSTKIEWIISKMKMAMRRLSKDDNQQDTNSRSSLFGYMFRTGRSRMLNSSLT